MLERRQTLTLARPRRSNRSPRLPPGRSGPPRPAHRPVTSSLTSSSSAPAHRLLKPRGCTRRVLYGAPFRIPCRYSGGVSFRDCLFASLPSITAPPLPSHLLGHLFEGPEDQVRGRRLDAEPLELGRDLAAVVGG